MSQSKLKPVKYRCDSIALPQTDLLEAVLKAVDRDGLRYALAHCDDGVVWGRRQENEQWAWSSGIVAASPAIRLQTLQQARLFGPQTEVLIWRDGAGWRARAIVEVEGEGEGRESECLSESYLLWGGPPGDASGDFLPLLEAGHGFQHAPPAEIARAGRVAVRHYVDFDSNGCARIAASRLTVDDA